MTRFRRSTLLLLLCATLSGCYDIDIGCIPLDGPCGGVGANNVPTIQLTGFPHSQVDYNRMGPDGGMIGVVPKGTSVTLYAIRVVGADAPINAPDTLRATTWGVSDSTRATITRGADGRGVLEGRAPGPVHVFVNGVFATVWSCEGNGCTRVTIEVASPMSISEGLIRRMSEPHQESRCHQCSIRSRSRSRSRASPGA